MNQHLEICTFNLEDFNKIINHNISRIELCSKKSIGGVSPPLQEVKYAVSQNIPIHTLLRPRGGNFSYNKKEIKSMINYISSCNEIGCKGIVLGIIDSNNEIDINNCKKILKEAKGMSKTFHMAFDVTRNPFDAMEKIIDLGFDRILTSGGGESAEEGEKMIRKLAEKSENRILIMPGLKLRSSNIDIFIRNKLINEYHSSCYINDKFSEKELVRLIKKIFN